MAQPSPTTTSRSEPAGLVIDVVYEQMRRKTVDELRRIVLAGERSASSGGRWVKTAKQVLYERLHETGVQ